MIAIWETIFGSRVGFYSQQLPKKLSGDGGRARVSEVVIVKRTHTIHTFLGSESISKQLLDISRLICLCLFVFSIAGLISIASP